MTKITITILIEDGEVSATNVANTAPAPIHAEPSRPLIRVPTTELPSDAEGDAVGETPKDAARRTADVGLHPTESQPALDDLASAISQAVGITKKPVLTDEQKMTVVKLGAQKRYQYGGNPSPKKIYVGIFGNGEIVRPRLLAIRGVLKEAGNAAA